MTRTNTEELLRRIEAWDRSHLEFKQKLVRWLAGQLPRDLPPWSEAISTRDDIITELMEALGFICEAVDPTERALQIEGGRKVLDRIRGMLSTTNHHEAG